MATKARRVFQDSKQVKIYRGFSNISLENFNPIASEYRVGENNLHVADEPPVSYSSDLKNTKSLAKRLLIEMVVPIEFFFPLKKHL